MFVVFGSLLAFVALLLAFGIGMMRMTGWLVLRMVERRHQQLEELVVDGRMPRLWAGGNRQHSWRAWRCRRRLDSLVIDVERSTLVADEETRQQLLDRLTAVRARL